MYKISLGMFLLCSLTASVWATDSVDQQNSETNSKVTTESQTTMPQSPKTSSPNSADIEDMD